jgi:hypothetical protein
VTIALFLSEPVRAGSTATFVVTIKNAATAETVGTMQLHLTGDGSRQYRDANGIPFPSEWSYDDVLAAACGRTQEIEA